MQDERKQAWSPWSKNVVEPADGLVQICRQTSHRHGGPVLGTSQLIKMQGKKTSLGSWAEAGLVDILVNLYAHLLCDYAIVFFLVSQRVYFDGFLSPSHFPPI